MQTLPNSLRIGVLRGGPSPEYDVSLKSGGNVLKVLSETHSPIDIFISKEGKWYINGIERSPERILKNVDVVWNALHGSFGEDGRVQEILNLNGIKYTGSDKYSSATTSNKWITKERVRSLGIKTPIAILVRREDHLVGKAKEIFNSIPHPLVIKPIGSGSSIGIQIADSFSDLLSALEIVLADYDSVVVEEYISGKSASVVVIDNFRGKPIYTLPAVEVSDGVVTAPGNFSEKEKKEMSNISEQVHKSLGLRHYSNSDFVVSPRRGVYYLETNTSPKMSEKSILPESLKAVGVSVGEFLHHILDLVHSTGYRV